MKEIRIKPDQKMSKETKIKNVKAAAQSTKLNKKAWEKVNKIINEPQQPTKALKNLMKKAS